MNQILLIIYFILFYFTVRLTLWTREPNCKLLFFYYSNDYDFPVKSPRWDLIIFMCYYFPIFI